MLRLAIDENFNNDILRGLLRRNPGLDAVRVQDAGLSGADDSTILAWAATESRLLLTHDAATITLYANERIAAGMQMPGVVVVGRAVSIGRAVDDILLLVELSLEGEWEGRILYLPLQ